MPANSFKIWIHFLNSISYKYNRSVQISRMVYPYPVFFFFNLALIIGISIQRELCSCYQFLWTTFFFRCLDVLIWMLKSQCYFFFEYNYRFRLDTFWSTHMNTPIYPSTYTHTHISHYDKHKNTHTYPIMINTKTHTHIYHYGKYTHAHTHISNDNKHTIYPVITHYKTERCVYCNMIIPIVQDGPELILQHNLSVSVLSFFPL